MIIQSDRVSMTSRRSYEQKTTTSSAVTFSDGSSTRNPLLGQIRIVSSDGSSKGSGNQEQGQNSRQNSGSGLFQTYQQTARVNDTSLSRHTPSDIRQIRQESINYLLMLLFGDDSLKDHYLRSIRSGEEDDYFAASARELSTQPAVSFGTYTQQMEYSEQESTSFSTTGCVKTADGREISFQLTMNMSRSFSQSYFHTQQAMFVKAPPQFFDPLVINLNGNPASVSDQEFYFDLDCDGTEEKLSSLGSGSAFLAYDKNGDGIINDGSELFGAKSGDGFADLAAYDDDGNGWIDENDAIFDKLKIWTKDADGNDSLCAIGKAGIGAIFLGSANTNFSLNSSTDNSTNALIRKTGIFLYESGACGTIQHVDLAGK